MQLALATAALSFGRVGPLQHGIANAEEWPRGACATSEVAQGTQRGHRRQHAQRISANEPCRIPQRFRAPRRRLGDEHLEQQARQRARRYDDQVPLAREHPSSEPNAPRGRAFQIEARTTPAPPSLLLCILLGQRVEAIAQSHHPLAISSLPKSIWAQPVRSRHHPQEALGGADQYGNERLIGFEQGCVATTGPDHECRVGGKAATIWARACLTSSPSDRCRFGARCGVP